MELSSTRSTHKAALNASPIRAGKIAEQYPLLEDGGALDVLLPKKDKMVVAKWRALRIVWA